MKKLLTLILIVSAYTSFGQAYNTLGGTNTIDTAYINHNFWVTGGIRFSSFGTSNTKQVLGFDAAGKGVLRTIPDAVVSIGALDANTTSTNSAVISGTTINMVSAAAGRAGVMTAGTQQIDGNKTFSGATTTVTQLVLGSTTLNAGIFSVPASFVIINSNSQNNCSMSFANSGGGVTRNVADTNAAYFINQNSSSSTGDIVRFQKAGVSLSAFRSSGGLWLKHPSNGTSSDSILVWKSDSTIGKIAPGGSGTVTSVGLTTSVAGLSVSGSPVTTSGAFSLSASSGQTANRFLATPNGSTGALSLRAIVAADLPAGIGDNIANSDLTANGNHTTDFGVNSLNIQSVGAIFLGDISNLANRSYLSVNDVSSFASMQAKVASVGDGDGNYLSTNLNVNNNDGSVNLFNCAAFTWNGDAVAKRKDIQYQIITSTGLNITLDDTYQTVNADATGGQVNITLPPAATYFSSNSGIVYHIKKIDASINSVKVFADSGETIDGSSSLTIGVQNDGLTIYTDGGRWWVQK